MKEHYCRAKNFRAEDFDNEEDYACSLLVLGKLI
jgi:hypothetical protein